MSGDVNLPIRVNKSALDFMLQTHEVPKRSSDHYIILLFEIPTFAEYGLTGALLGCSTSSTMLVFDLDCFDLVDDWVLVMHKDNKKNQRII